jgi:hypothetical protein
MPEKNGDVYYYIEVEDEWGNVVTSGDSSSPHKISVINAPVDLGAIMVWGMLFSSIGLLYIGLFIHFRKPVVEEEENEEEVEE